MPTPQNGQIQSHSQTIRRQQMTNYLSMLDHFVGLALNWVRLGLIGDLVYLGVPRLSSTLLSDQRDNLLRSVYKQMNE